MNGRTRIQGKGNRVSCPESRDVISVVYKSPYLVKGRQTTAVRTCMLLIGSIRPQVHEVSIVTCTRATEWGGVLSARMPIRTQAVLSTSTFSLPMARKFPKNALN